MVIASFMEDTWVLISLIDSAVFAASSCPVFADTITSSESFAILPTFSLLLCIFEAICSTAAAVSSREAAWALAEDASESEELERVFIFPLNCSPLTA